MKKEPEEIVAVRWRHAKPTWEWVWFGYPTPKEFFEEAGDKVEWFPFKIRFAYWFDYMVLGCRFARFCHWVDQIQEDYRNER